MKVKFQLFVDNELCEGLMAPDMQPLTLTQTEEFLERFEGLFIDETGNLTLEYDSDSGTVKAVRR